MKRRSFLKQSVFAASGAIAVPLGIGFIGRRLGEATPGETARLKKGSLKVLVLEGSPRKRGQIHGEALRTKIQKNIGLWK
jgi:hypothetical protein